MKRPLNYQWIPGSGTSHDAVKRIRYHRVVPAEPMGEAWFNTNDRRMFAELFEPNAIKEMDRIDLTFLLFEIASGKSCFGHLPEWDDWFRYLLPDLIDRGGETLYFETTVLQSVVTAFMQIFWGGIEEHYVGFRDDVMWSVPSTIMGEGFCSDTPEGPRPVFLDLQTDGRGETKLFWNTSEPDPSVSAAMFCCVKYLTVEELPVWVDSVTAIEHDL